MNATGCQNKLLTSLFKLGMEFTTMAGKDMM